MRDPLLTIDNMYKSLKPGGVVFVHCPNYMISFELTSTSFSSRFRADQRMAVSIEDQPIP
jgi:hypothetical protein